MRTLPAKPGKDSHPLDYFFAAHINSLFERNMGAAPLKGRKSEEETHA